MSSVASVVRAAATTLLATLLAGSVSAQSPEPATGAWPTGDALRRDLQQIGFVFRIDGATGDWLGWAPPATSGDAPAMGLAGAGTRPAQASVDVLLIGEDPALALTAFLEVASRLPLAPDDVDLARRFIVDDLLEAPPETLEPCYATDWGRGAARIRIDAETTSARIEVAETTADLDAEDEVPECAPLIPSEVAARLGDPSSERVSISVGGDPTAFDPPEVKLDGALVTLVLTFRNDSAEAQSITFEDPLEATTGLLAPGELKLIVVRQLEPGEYPFFSDTDPEGLRGSIQIDEPTADDEPSGE